MSENNKEQQGNNQHPFDRLMFGGNRRISSTPKDNSPSQEEQKPTSSSTNEEFDLMNMLQSVDQLMGSVNKLKPMMQQITPLFDLFKSKK